MTPSSSSVHPAVRFYAQSHVGRVRTANEDSYIVADLGEPDGSSSGALLVVADGMGGSVGGAQASRAVVQTLRDQLAGGIQAQAGAQLAEAVRIANRTVHSIPMQQPELRGMGSTCTAMVLRGDQVHIGHVGDSRAYLVRGGRILQLTHDHTKVHLLLQTGMITPEEAAVHPERSVLVRSIGPKPEVDVDQLPPLKIQDGDRVLLCSDGLINHVADPEILALVEDRAEDEAVECLVHLALERGGSDNTTVLMMVVGPRPRTSVPAAPPTIHEPVSGPRVVPREVAGPPPKSRTGVQMLLLAAAAGLACMVVVVGAGVFWLSSSPPDPTQSEVAPSTAPSQPASEMPKLTEQAKAAVFPSDDTVTAASRARPNKRPKGAPTPNPLPTPEDADGDGYSEAQGDCDDTDDNVFPDALEIWYDGVDQDCDDKDDYDADGDDYRSDEHGGNDCNDQNRDIRPGAKETWYDDVDQNCDDKDDYDADGDGLKHTEECDDTDPKSRKEKVDEENCDGKPTLTCKRQNATPECTFVLEHLGQCKSKKYPLPDGPVQWLHGEAKKNPKKNVYKPIHISDVPLEDVYILCDCKKETCDLQSKYHN